MVLTFPVIEYLGNMNDTFGLLEDEKKDQILIKACTNIEELLGNMNYLKEFSWMGMQAFYTGEKGALCDSFYVSLDAGGNNFLISNQKTVSSSVRDYNLFEDLLWYGFGPYTAPSFTKHSTEEEDAYYNRTKKMQREFGMLFHSTRGMTFYNRYAGRKFWNLKHRRGMDPSLVNQFHRYIYTAINRGVLEAMKSVMSQDEHQLMGGE